MQESDHDQEWYYPVDPSSQAKQEQPSNEIDLGDENDDPDIDLLAEKPSANPRRAQLEKWLAREQEQTSPDKILVNITNKMLPYTLERERYTAQEIYTPEEVEVLLEEVCDYQTFLANMNMQQTDEYRVKWIETLRRTATEHLDKMKAIDLAGREAELNRESSDQANQIHEPQSSAEDTVGQPPLKEKSPEPDLPERQAVDARREQFKEWITKEDALPDEDRHDRLISITGRLVSLENGLSETEIEDLIRELQMYKEFMNDTSSSPDEDSSEENSADEKDYHLEWLDSLRELAIERLRIVIDSNNQESIGILAEAEEIDAEAEEAEHFENEFKAQHIERLDEMMDALPLAEFQEFVQKKNLDIGVLASLEKHLQGYIKSVEDLGSNLETSGFSGVEDFQITPYVQEATRVLAAVRIRLSTEQTRENINSLLSDMNM